MSEAEPFAVGDAYPHFREPEHYRYPWLERDALRSFRALRFARWTPPGPGFYRITVLDAEGEAANSEIRVRGGS